MLNLGNKEQALLLLKSLPDSWETLVVSLSNSAPDGKLTMVIVNDALFNEEARRKEAGMDQSHAFVTEGMHQRSGRGRSRGRSMSRGRSQKPGGYQEGKMKCFHCGIEGHIKRNCRKLQREQG